MTLLLALIAISVIAGSIVADYKWRSWVAARRSRYAWPYEPPVTPASPVSECLSESPEAADLVHTSDGA